MRPGWKDQIRAIKPNQIITIAVCLTVVVTLISLNELQTLIATSDSNEHAAFLPTHKDWRTVEQIAERAVQHVEHLPAISHQRHAGQTADWSEDTIDVMQLPSKQQQQQGKTAGDLQRLAAVADIVSGAGDSSSSSSSSSGSSSKEEEPEPPPAAKECHAQEFTELWGDVVKWGSSFHTKTPGDCCSACLKHKPKAASDPPCNVWVWCGVKDLCGSQYHECWLKHLVHPHASKPAREGSDVGWTSGIVGPDAEQEKPVEEQGEKKVRKYHVITTAQGPAVHWQVRVHYYWYLKQKAECDKSPGCEMGGFTRLLHSGQPDDLMDEIPSFVAQPLPESVVAHEWYPVLNRPYAFVQWVQQANISEEFVLMSEPDHIFLRPIPNVMKRDDWPAAFPFFYIEAHKDDNIPIVAKFIPGGQLSKVDAETIAPIGNSPTFLSMAQMRSVMPLWQNLSVAIYKDKEANQKWGWVQEMYAFTIALYVHGVRHVDLVLHLMAQPPWDNKMQLSRDKPYYILHYTYGNDFTLDGKHTPGKYGAWRFDKRTYATKPPPRHLGPPPANMKNDMVRALISHINEASENIPCWDEYYQTGSKPKTCSEKIPGSIYPGAT